MADEIVNFGNKFEQFYDNKGIPVDIILSFSDTASTSSSLPQKSSLLSGRFPPSLSGRSPPKESYAFLLEHVRARAEALISAAEEADGRKSSLNKLPRSWT